MYTIMKGNNINISLRNIDVRNKISYLKKTLEVNFKNIIIITYRLNNYYPALQVSTCSNYIHILYQHRLITGQYFSCLRSRTRTTTRCCVSQRVS